MLESIKLFLKKIGIKFRTELPHTRANYWLMCIELDNRQERDLFLKQTNKNKVLTRPIWQLIFRSPIYSGFQRDSQINAIYLEDRIVNIPSIVSENNIMKKTIIIAEAGVNHNGDINLAKKLIDVASKAKVDYVKFQTFKAENLASKDSEKAPYQNLNSKEEESQFNMLRKLELDYNDHKELIGYCKKKKIKFLSSALI